jgi:signal transduction histidine kinase
VSADDFRASVAALAKMAVPRLADWCCIDVVLPQGTIEPAAAAHKHSRLSAGLRTLRKRLRIDPDAETGIARVVETGVAEFHFDLGAALSAAPGQRALVAELAELAGFRAAIVTPLAAREHVFGAVTLVVQKGSRLFDEGDVLLADAFAAQAALALDNVRLFFGKDREAPAFQRIAGVTGGIALLDPETLGTKLLETVASEKDRLSDVVHSVILASSLGSARLDTTAETSDVVAVVRAAIESVRGTLPPEWRLELEQPSVLGAGDATTIRRIVTCLVDNAVAYSPSGGSITVRLEAAEAGVRLYVEDKGIGIPPGERELVFEKFFRGEGGRAVRREGVGLGLYICRALATRLNGRVEVLDEAGGGTTVFVELPLAPAPTPEPEEVVAAEKAPRPRRRPMTPP